MDLANNKTKEAEKLVEMFTMIMLLLVAILLSNMINHFIPFIPVPLIQIALGGIVALLPLGMDIPLEPELFFILFIAPLLFNDGKNVPRKALWKLREPILFLALGLVFVTVFVIGYVIHWLIPTLPLPAAFALAAILSPTDVVAVGAMSGRVKMPKDIMHLLEGEGLMNDASGLVAFKFAVAATVTGYFSLTDATLSFLGIAIGGFAGGAVIAFLIIRFRVLIRRFGMEDVTVHMLLQILTPFVIYLVIEHFHLSGILGVVAGGIVHAIERDREESPTVRLRIVSKSTWTVILYVLNGLVFILLGLQVPAIAQTIFEDINYNNGQVLMYILIITLALFAMRFLWVYLSWSAGWKLNKSSFKPSWRGIGLVTVSGVRGAVTLAGTFSIPFTLADGNPFPERSLIIFIAAGVILLSLLIASIFLPLIAEKDEKQPTENANYVKERKAFVKVCRAAIDELNSSTNEGNEEEVVVLRSQYKQLINDAYIDQTQKNSFRYQKSLNQVWLTGLQAEKEYLEQQLKNPDADKEAIKLSLTHTKRMELALTAKLGHRLVMMWVTFKRLVFRFLGAFSSKAVKRARKERKLKRRLATLKMESSRAAVDKIRESMTAENRDASMAVIKEYHALISKLVSRKGRNQSVMDALSHDAIQAERDKVQEMYEQKSISFDMAQRLRQNITMRELLIAEDNETH